MKIKKENKNKIVIIILVAIIVTLFLIVFPTTNQKAKIQTSKGEIIIELYSNKAPTTVENFKTYVEEDFYDGTVFHRVIPGFMIQAGGFTQEGQQKQTHSPIILESDNGLLNEKYTIAMARTKNPNSATSQFFINTANNNFLNYGVRDEGYAVFGKVISGFEIVDEIEKVQTISKNGAQNWPVENIIIEKIELI
jgi:cyclophilin family peptidyl-prolyl cis-trans isomerase